MSLSSDQVTHTSSCQPDATPPRRLPNSPHCQETQQPLVPSSSTDFEKTSGLYLIIISHASNTANLPIATTTARPYALARAPLFTECSAINTAFRAAPRSSWSPDTKNSRPCLPKTKLSRIRPTC